MRHPDAEPSAKIIRTTVHNTRVILVAFKQRRKKIRQPLRRVGDPVTSIAALLVLATLGSLGLVVLALTLALGF